MENDYLATGFADVDRGDEGTFSGCLQLLDSLPYFQWYKAETYRYLDLKPGLSVLDAGCGLGDDCSRICVRVSPHGRVTGVDASAVMVNAACHRWAGQHENLTFEIGDARRLPFPAASFDRARIDRSLQHIVDPEAAVRELHRVLKPGGLAVAYDNDWGTFSVSSENIQITRKVQDEWCYSFTNPWIGRHLALLFRKAGFENISVHPSVSVISDFETADRVYDLRKTLERLISTAQLSREEADEWVNELRQQTTNCTFQVSLTAYIVVGWKMNGSSLRSPLMPHEAYPNDPFPEEPHRHPPCQ